VSADPEAAPDVVALGETMLSLVASGPLADAEALHVTHGGAESNVCVGLARLGLRPAWVSRLGDDPPGDRVARDLAAAGVDLRWVARDAVRPTGLMIRDTVGTVRYERAGSAASALSPSDLDEVPVDQARAVFVSGITALIGESPREATRELLSRAKGLRVFDPNLRPGLVGSDDAVGLIEPLLNLADIVLGGERELQAFADARRGEDLARAIADRGPAEVVVRSGFEGAAVLDPVDGWVGIAPEAVPDVDPVGAGDAFTAGYLAARLAGAPAAERLAVGARCGAAAASSLGDTAPFGQK
jgi:2-dehydro-3-deoxygluconokinase